MMKHGDQWSTVNDKIRQKWSMSNDETQWMIKYGDCCITMKDEVRWMIKYVEWWITMNDELRRMMKYGEWWSTMNIKYDEC